MLRDFQYALRQLRRSKLFGTTVMLLLALGIGANTVIFSFIDELLLKPLPVRDAANLFLLEKMRAKQIRPDDFFFYRQFERVNQRKNLFTAAVAEQEWTDYVLQPFTDGDRVRMVVAQMVSPNYFSELGVKATRGRLLTESDAVTPSNIPIVLSYQFWHSQFHAAPDVIGRTLRLKNYPFLIVGVAARDFHGLDIDRVPDIRLPISAAPVLTGYTVTEPGGDQPVAFRIFARLAPGVSAAHAEAAMLPEMRALEESEWRASNARNPHPLSQKEVAEQTEYNRDFHLNLQPAGRGISVLRVQFSHVLILLMGAVGLLLAAVCANVTGLLYARAEERRREIALRLSLGASRWQILRQISTEYLLLAVPGAGFGIALAYAVSPFLIRLLPPVRELTSFATQQVLAVAPDPLTLLFAVALALAIVAVLAISATSHSMRLNLSDELKAAGRSATGAIPGVAAIAVQIALSIVLLAAAGLMLRTFWNLEHLNPGFDRAHVVEFTVDPRDAGYSEAQANNFYRELKRRVSDVPGVRSAAYTSMAIMHGFGMMTTVAPQGVVLPKKTFLNTSVNEVTPSYFDTLGIPLLAGRSLEPGDVGKKPMRIVVNRAFAEFLFPRQNPVGKAIVQGADGTKPPAAIIVGVVGTAKYRSLREIDPPIYYSASDYFGRGVWGGVLYVRTHGDPQGIIRSVRAAVRQLDNRIPIREIFTLDQEVERSLWQERLLTILSAFFGVAAALLSAIGLYGALAYSVSRRFRELGIRIAIGAQVRHVVAAVSGPMIWSFAGGVLAGVFAAAALLRFAKPLVFGVPTVDPVSLALASALLLLCSIAAAALPIRRALKTDAAFALREE